MTCRQYSEAERRLTENAAQDLHPDCLDREPALAEAREQDALLRQLVAAVANLLADRFEDHAAIADTGECEQGCVKCGHSRDAEAAIAAARAGTVVQFAEGAVTTETECRHVVQSGGNGCSCAEWDQQRAALVAALKDLVGWCAVDEGESIIVDNARAALKNAGAS